jgi:CelD/BcsL family acetyltransferase involved in cellulose biosynthesis
MRNFKIKIQTKLGDKDFRKWQVLWQKSEYSYIQNSPSWFQAYSRAYSIQDYKVIFITEENRLRLVLPLVRSRVMFISSYTFPGERMIDHSGLLVDRQDYRLINFLLKEVKNLKNVYLGENTRKLFKPNLNNNLNLFFKDSSVNYYLKMKNDPLRSMSKKNYRKILNRYSKNRNNLDHRCYDGNSTYAIEKIFKLSAKSHKRKVKGYTDPFANDNGIFLLELFKRIPEKVTIDILFFNKQPIAFFLGYVHKSTYFAFQTAYLSEFRKLNPGKVLLYLLFKRLQNEEITMLDFGRGESHLKKELTNSKRRNIDVYLSNNPLVLFWWFLALKLKVHVKGNKIIYQFYCFLRKTEVFIANSFKTVLLAR